MIISSCLLSAALYTSRALIIVPNVAVFQCCGISLNTYFFVTCCHSVNIGIAKQTCLALGDSFCHKAVAIKVHFSSNGIRTKIFISLVLQLLAGFYCNKVSIIIPTIVGMTFYLYYLQIHFSANSNKQGNNISPQVLILNILFITSAPTI